MSDTNLNSENCSTEPQPQPNVRPFQQEETLRRLYHDEDLSQEQIGDRFGVSQQTIGYWMAEHEIETRPPMHERDRTISVPTREDGRTQFKVPNFDRAGEPIRTSFYRYQLVALLANDDDGDWLYSISDVFGDNTHVHHRMNAPVPVDIPDNLEVLAVHEHHQLHASFSHTDEAEAVLSEVFEEYSGEPDPEEVGDTGNVEMPSRGKQVDSADMNGVSGD
ncbi:hypothetical protein GRX03_03430 [Halovenus sp. WSH3]|uniref:HTH cro/C1-type domain-containing protein n=1 Tax=Halovenus carboxidivorans TaxID=2692199 RepID=A0A6B0T622_9EURY|nr:hypothetical protein [Halovenus carboxidivorans]MXR50661.1 hypothetical protein [Halovenus carboxidivorans]